LIVQEDREAMPIPSIELATQIIICVLNGISVSLTFFLIGSGKTDKTAFYRATKNSPTASILRRWGLITPMDF
jgi:hypothetical protein